jgi:Tfp pilus assembly protein PilX
MRSNFSQFEKGVRRKSRQSQTGAALVTTMLLLMLLVGMSLTMVLSVSSDMLINGYYRNGRGSFYAADSGLNIARQSVANAVIASAPVGAFNAAVQPIPPGTDTAVQTNITNTYKNFTALNAGESSTSWPEQFKITNASFTFTNCKITGGTAGATCTVPTQTSAQPITGYTYVYNYSLTAAGASSGSENAVLLDTGTMTFNVAVKPAGPVVTSFASYGMFIDQFSVCSADLVPGTITGPVFTNGAWTFGTGSYEFTDPVGSVSGVAGYDNGGCVQSAKTSANSVSPKFDQGFTMGQAKVTLPQNDYSQKRAVLDGKGAALDSNGNPIVPPAVTNTDLNAGLKDVNAKAYPAAGAASGVYLPYTVDSKGVATFTGGGIYVKGDAAVTLQASGATAQVYTIVQSGVTTTVTIDNGTQTTSISSGGTTKTIAGVPQQLDPTGAFVRDGTMLYVDGNITGLSGPGEGPSSPAIQDNSAVTVTANGNIAITGDIRYKSEPVTLTQTTSGTPPVTIPADTLITANDHGQVLGIFTSAGDIQLNNKQSDQLLEIDGSLATLAQNGTGGVVNTGAAIKNLNIVGGRIQNQIKNINATNRNVFYDRRFSKGGFAPPWFPSTSISQTGQDSATVAPPTLVRTQWLNQNPFF